MDSSDELDSLEPLEAAMDMAKPKSTVRSGIRRLSKKCIGFALTLLITLPILAFCIWTYLSSTFFNGINHDSKRASEVFEGPSIGVSPFREIPTNPNPKCDSKGKRFDSYSQSLLEQQELDHAILEKIAEIPKTTELERRLSLLNELCEENDLMRHPFRDGFLGLLNDEIWKVEGGYSGNTTEFKVTYKGKEYLLKSTTDTDINDLEIYEDDPVHSDYIKYVSSDRKWYLTEYLEANTIEELFQQGGSLMARDAVAGVLIEAERLYRRGILVKNLKMKNIRIKKRDNEPMSFMIVNVNCNNHVSNPSKVKNSMHMLGKTLLKVNNMIKERVVGRNDKRYYSLKNAEYSIASDDAKLADLILVALGETEHQPQNLTDLLRHPLFTNESLNLDGSDTFGRRSYCVSGKL